MKMKIYISGPMTDKPDHNKAAFESAETTLRLKGHEVANPHNNGVPSYAPYEDHMRADLKMLLDCDAILMLPGWTQSRGAFAEHRVADILRLSVFVLDTIDAVPNV